MGWRDNPATTTDHHIPVPLATLLKAKGKIVATTGVSSRAIVKMPDGRFFEEGTDHDGACYCLDNCEYTINLLKKHSLR